MAMGRRGLNFITGLSLLTCMLSAAYWVRSRYVSESIGWSSAAVPLAYGEFRTRGMNGEWGRVTLFATFHPKTRTRPVYGPLRTQGLVWFNLRYENRAPGWYLGVTIPLWFVFVTTLILPTIRLHLLLRCGDPEEIRCVECGYDLRATPERCPECGTIVAV
jgi:hypothetical protein